MFFHAKKSCPLHRKIVRNHIFKIKQILTLALFLSDIVVELGVLKFFLFTEFSYKKNVLHFSFKILLLV